MRLSVGYWADNFHLDDVACRKSRASNPGKLKFVVCSALCVRNRERFKQGPAESGNELFSFLFVIKHIVRHGRVSKQQIIYYCFLFS